MKKFLLPILLLAATYSHTQNTAWPATNSADNVGIGTNSPTEKLQISGGNLLINNASWYSAKNTSYITTPILGIASDNNIYVGDLFGKTNSYLLFRTSGADRLFITSSGNIGIGLNDPIAVLHVNGDITLTAAAGAANAYLSFQRSSDSYTGARIGNSYSMNGYQGHLVFETNNGGGTVSLTERMRITATGKVGIGTSTPDQLLSVKGTIHSQTVLVDMMGWGDFVFDKEYHLQTLPEVKQYVQENHHLPDVPSEADIIKNGLDI